MGNLNAFSRQTVRCTKCNEKYRRMPLSGSCPTCGTGLTMTVHEASVVKYLDVTKKLVDKYDVNLYTRQRVEKTERDIASLFTNDHAKQSSLFAFGGPTDGAPSKDDKGPTKKRKGKGPT